MCTYKSREELFVLELMQKSRLDNFFLEHSLQTKDCSTVHQPVDQNFYDFFF